MLVRRPSKSKMQAWIGGRSKWRPEAKFGLGEAESGRVRCHLCLVAIAEVVRMRITCVSSIKRASKYKEIEFELQAKVDVESTYILSPFNGSEAALRYARQGDPFAGASGVQEDCPASALS